MTDTKTMVTALNLIADELQAMEGSIQAQCIRDAAVKLANTQEGIEQLSKSFVFLKNKFSKLEGLATEFIEDSDEIADFIEALGGRNHLLIATDIRKMADDMAALLNDECKDGE